MWNYMMYTHVVLSTCLYTTPCSRMLCVDIMCVCLLCRRAHTITALIVISTVLLYVGLFDSMTYDTNYNIRRYVMGTCTYDTKCNIRRYVMGTCTYDTNY